MWTELSRQFCESVGIELPIIQAPMAGGITTERLVAEVSRAGGLGSIGAGYMTASELDELIVRVKSLTSRPFGVNVFIPPANARAGGDERFHQAIRQAADILGMPCPDLHPPLADPLLEHLEVILEHDVRVVSFTFGVLDHKLIERLRARGSLVLGTATCTDEAVALEQAGCSAVVLQGCEAGGHRGSFLYDPPPCVGLVSLLQTCRRALRVPLIAAGGLKDGAGVLGVLAMGASAAQMGTVFLTTTESGADRTCKQAVGASRDVNTVLTKAFSGKPARGVRNAFIDMMEPYRDSLPPYPVLNAITAPIRKRAKALANAGFMSNWCGQSGGLAHEVSAAALLRDIVADVENRIGQFGSRTTPRAEGH